MRIFLAVFPPPATQALAERAIEALRRPGDGVSWVRRENLHYTLRFIGEVGADGARRVEEAARGAVSGRARFPVALGGAGAFPNSRRARVLWLGASQGAEPFAALARALESALAKRGFAPEERRFTAHLTIGRVREPGRDWAADLAALPALEGTEARFEVASIDVVESRLAPKGSIYTVRARAELGADGS